MNKPCCCVLIKLYFKKVDGDIEMMDLINPVYHTNDKNMMMIENDLNYKPKNLSNALFMVFFFLVNCIHEAPAIL